MNILLISLIMVFIVAAGLVSMSTTGFFVASDDTGQGDAFSEDNRPAFRLSLGPDRSGDSNGNDEVPDDEDDVIVLSLIHI